MDIMINNLPSLDGAKDLVPTNLFSIPTKPIPKNFMDEEEPTTVTHVMDPFLQSKHYKIKESLILVIYR
jgi:hypothetical protein